MSAIKEIKQTVLSFPARQRAQLTESLLESLPPVGEVWTDAQELAEAERRDRQIVSGEVQPISEKEFWKRVESRRER